MKAIKKLIEFLSIIALSILLVGCSNNGLTSSTSDDSEESSQLNSNEHTTKTIRLGLAPDEDSASILRKFEPFIKYLSEETGYEIEPYVGADYTAVIQAMDSGHLDIAWFGPSEYVLATEEVNSGIEAFAKAIQNEDSIEYRTAFVVSSNSDYQDISDIEGGTMAFTDPASTSVHIFGRYSLVKDGINPEEYFNNVIYAGSHDAALLAVINGQADIAAVSSRKIPGFIESGLIDEDQIKIIYNSVEIPADPITFKKDLDKEIKEAFKEALINNPEAVKKSLENTEFSHFEQVNDSDYDIVREAYEISGQEPEV